MQFNSYLLFDGNCEEAFTTYAKIFGAKIEMMLNQKLDRVLFLGWHVDARHGLEPTGEGVEPGGGRVLECLAKHKGELSTECQKVVTAHGG